MARVPGRGSLVQAPAALGIATNLGAEHLAEQTVESVPHRPALDRDQEGTRMPEVCQLLFAVLPSGERVREVTADAVGDAGAQEQVLSFRRQARENLGIQVPGDALVLAAEIPGDLRRIDLTFHGQRGHVDPAWPALRAAVELAQHHA